MEKQITMSLDTARKIKAEHDFCKDVNAGLNLGLSALYNLVIENFTEEELKGRPKGFTWEESFGGVGYEIIHDVVMQQNVCGDGPKSCKYKDLFKTAAQAESALAFAQLSHIVAKYNEGKVKGQSTFFVASDKNGLVCVPGFDDNITGLDFYYRDDAKLSMIANRELWLKFLMVKGV